MILACKRKPVRRFLTDLNQRVNDPNLIIRVCSVLNEKFLPYVWPMALGIFPIVAIALYNQWLYGPAWKPDSVRKLLIVSGMGFGIWWVWLAPRRDYLVAHEAGFRWRMWISKWGLLPQSGEIRYDQITAFAFREFWDKPESPLLPLDAPAGEQLAQILSKALLGKYDVVIDSVSSRSFTLDNLLCRFEESDTREFLVLVKRKLGAEAQYSAS